MQPITDSWWATIGFFRHLFIWTLPLLAASSAPLLPLSINATTTRVYNGTFATSEPNPGPYSFISWVATGVNKAQRTYPHHLPVSVRAKPAEGAASFSQDFKNISVLMSTPARAASIEIEVSAATGETWGTAHEKPGQLPTIMERFPWADVLIDLAEAIELMEAEGFPGPWISFHIIHTRVGAPLFPDQTVYLFKRPAAGGVIGVGTESLEVRPLNPQNLAQIHDENLLTGDADASSS